MPGPCARVAEGREGVQRRDEAKRRLGDSILVAPAEEGRGRLVHAPEGVVVGAAAEQVELGAARAEALAYGLDGHGVEAG